jgi:hypothetical protein
LAKFFILCFLCLLLFKFFGCGWPRCDLATLRLHLLSSSVKSVVHFLRLRLAALRLGDFALKGLFNHPGSFPLVAAGRAATLRLCVNRNFMVEGWAAA